MKKEALTHIFFLCINAALITWVAMSAPDIHPDSKGYISNSILRAPIYPVLIDGARALFGPKHFLQAVVCLQVLFCVPCIAYFTRAVKKHFTLSLSVAYAIFTLFTFPLVKIGPSILSEAVGWGLQALFMGLLVHHVFQQKPRHLIAMIGITGLELLLRPQFLFVFVFMLCYAAFLLIRHKQRVYAVALVALLCLWVSVFFIRNTYNLAYSDHFGQHSAIGEHLLATQLYISPPSDAEDFSDPTEQAYLKELYKRIERDKLSIRHWNYTKSHYNLSTVTLYYQHMLPLYAKMFGNTGVESSIQMDAMCKRIGIQLMKKNWRAYIKLLISKLYLGPFNYLVLFSVLTALALGWYIMSQSPQALLYLCMSTLTVFGYGMLFPFAVVVKRYTLFCDAYQFLFTALIGASLLREYCSIRKTV